MNADAQAPSASSLRSTPTAVEQSDARAQFIIAKAEDHFKKGLLNLTDNRREQARDEFDRAIDSILDSGMDVRSNPRLRTYYLELVERIYREEVPIQQVQPAATATNAGVVAQNSTRTTADAVNPQQPVAPQIGFRQQKFEPSPLDELSKLELTAQEQQVTPEATAELEQAKSAVDFGFRSNALIQQFINYYQGRGRSTMETGLRRSGRYMRLARKIFREEGVPEDIAWLGQIESAWRPQAYSSAAASGLWQFIPST
ncbi:MAG: transglycosylase SLT domain-containing protein, partial [Pyrinomonadaceae bacterium]|nr:transglycosylase SLT domain-containing protein [Pyrinomonadaceae bacterium]